MLASIKKGSYRIFKVDVHAGSINVKRLCNIVLTDRVFLTSEKPRWMEVAMIAGRSAEIEDQTYFGDKENLRGYTVDKIVVY